MRTTRREQVATELASYYNDEYDRIGGERATSRVWAYFDESKRAYCLRGEGLPAHPQMRAQYPNGWSLLSYVKPTEARRLIVERPRIQTAYD